MFISIPGLTHFDVSSEKKYSILSKNFLEFSSIYELQRNHYTAVTLRLIFRRKQQKFCTAISSTSRFAPKRFSDPESMLM